VIVGSAPRRQLALAAAGLLLAALDAYAVVTLLPQMLSGVGVSVDNLQAASPVVSGFLGGYVVAMPLLSTLSDQRGRGQALSLALVLFVAGSSVTALAPSLPWLVAGRVAQGLGGGALVPPTMALAADLFPRGERGTAVGAVSALQEAGSVLGPVYGALVGLGPAGWRTLFWLNLPLTALVLLGLGMNARSSADGLATTGAVPAPPARANWTGAGLLGATLALVVFGLYPNDPARSALNPWSWALLAAALGLALTFVAHQSRLLNPLRATRIRRDRVLGGAAAANLLSGAALMVALVDIPLLARGALGLGSLASGLLLMRLLAGIPLGALAGGVMDRRSWGAAAAGGGLCLAALAFAAMSTWTRPLNLALISATSAELLLCGVGMGGALAPLTTVMLDRAPDSRRSLFGSVTVLTRTLGMIIGVSGLTAFGLFRFGQIMARQGCATQAATGSLSARITAYEDCARGALFQEYQELFRIAAVLLVLAAGLALATLWAARSNQPVIQV